MGNGEELSSFDGFCFERTPGLAVDGGQIHLLEVCDGKKVPHLPLRCL